MQGDFIEKEDSRPISGYGTALLVDENNDGYYSLTIPLETVPTVFGDEDAFEYDILISKAKGSVKGKMTLDTITTDYLLTRENNYRLSQLEGKTLSYMVFHNNFTGYTFSGSLSYRDNDAEADILRGTLSLTPLSIGDKFFDGRDMVRQTLDFAGTLPDKVTLDEKNKTSEINLGIAQADANATYELKVIGASGNFTVTEIDGKLTITAKEELDHSSYAMIYITAKSTTKMKTDNGEVDKYSPWTMTIAVEYKA